MRIKGHNVEKQDVTS
ncbi:Protein of unknown function [Bacillus wiedmannii]|uniref:Uncharacterized protein n=1 Tax=Bacillus wiedmannii TaxID=1890302 RepID=A0AB37YKZ7_9BACI|nr:Protein of unknown function [Bacillus wiedmannii]